jgi:hypothetical protein
MDDAILKKLAERGVESAKFHGLDSVVFDKFGFSGMEIVDVNVTIRKDDETIKKKKEKKKKKSDSGKYILSVI